jgi:hypothetical protein
MVLTYSKIAFSGKVMQVTMSKTSEMTIKIDARANAPKIMPKTTVERSQ